MKRKLVIAVFAFGISTVASAISPILLVTGQGASTNFHCFEDDRGGFYLTWTELSAGSEFLLRAQHIGADSRTLWAGAGLVVSSAVTSAEDWSGLADGQGGLTLFWDEADGVHAQRFFPDGSRRRPGNSVRLSTATAIQPDAVADALGGTLLVWRETLAQNRSVLMAQRVDAEGKPLWMRGGLRVSLRASHQTNPRVIYDNLSGMIVAWRDEANQASELRVQRMDFRGNRLWTLEGLKITAPMGKSEFPVIAPARTGNVLIAWPEAVNQTNQIRLQNVGPNPVLKWESPVYASNTAGTYNRWNPLLLGDQSGGAWIAWEDYRNQINYQLQLNHLNADGSSRWTTGETAVGPAPGDQGKTAMAEDGKDGVWLAWIDNRLATVGLYLQEINGSGNRLFGNGGQLIADRLVKPSPPQLVPLAVGRTAIVWADRPKKDQWTLFWIPITKPE